MKNKKETFDVTSSVPHFINAVAIRINTRMDNQLRKKETTWRQIALLMNCINGGGKRSINFLAEALGCNAPSASRLADRLEKQGYIERKREGIDRRGVEVHITPKGKKLVDEVKSIRESEFHNFLKPLTKAEQEQLKKLLAKLLED